MHAASCHVEDLGLKCKRQTGDGAYADQSLAPIPYKEVQCREQRLSYSISDVSIHLCRIVPLFFDVAGGKHYRLSSHRCVNGEP
jgi:hypothetical protein